MDTDMKLQNDSLSPGSLLIRSYSSAGIQVNNTLYTSSFLILPTRVISADIPAELEGVEPAHISLILSLKPEVLLLGTGPHPQWPTAALLAPLLQHSIGVECMTTDAACRSFNILVSEDRLVAALMLGVGPSTIRNHAGE